MHMLMVTGGAQGLDPGLDGVVLGSWRLGAVCSVWARLMLVSGNQ
jgi:hypothetical protein